MSVGPSVVPSVRPLVGPSICRLVHLLVTQALKKCISAVFDHNYYQYERERILCRVSGLVYRIKGPKRERLKLKSWGVLAVFDQIVFFFWSISISKFNACGKYFTPCPSSLVISDLVVVMNWASRWSKHDRHCMHLDTLLTKASYSRTVECHFVSWPWAMF